MLKRTFASGIIFLIAVISLEAQSSYNFGLTQQQKILPESSAPEEILCREKPIDTPGKLTLSGNREYVLSEGWRMTEGYKMISKPVLEKECDMSDWYNATVPGTVLTTLVEQGVYPDPYVGLNNMSIPDTLCRMDWWYRIEFDSPETIRDLEIIRKAGNDALRGRKSCRAEIAVVVDEKSFDYLAFDNVCYRNFPRREYRADGSVSSYYAETLRLTGNLVSFQRARLEKIGAPVDYLLASDVAANAGNYKFWIFLDVFTADEAFREAVRKLRKDRNVLLWFYAPGVIDGDTFGEENIRKLTGISVREVSSGRSPEILLPDGQIAGMPEKIPLLYSPDDSAARILGTYLDSGLPGAAEKMIGSARDIFWGGNVVPVSLLRDFARKAGVHIYSDNGDVLFAGNGFLTFHAASAGEKTIRLPAESTVSDLFSGSAVLKQGKCFSFKAKLHETRIFRIREK